jgi:hypothetical protein
MRNCLVGRVTSFWKTQFRITVLGGVSRNGLPLGGKERSEIPPNVCCFVILIPRGIGGISDDT